MHGHFHTRLEWNRLWETEAHSRWGDPWEMGDLCEARPMRGGAYKGGFD